MGSSSTEPRAYPELDRTYSFSQLKGVWIEAGALLQQDLINISTQESNNMVFFWTFRKKRRNFMQGL